jgi:ABC-type multidrug transport system ATPase subunit
MREMRKTTMEILDAYVRIAGITSPDLPVEDLSGGQAQAVAIARAVHFKRDILLLDEPTSALDPAGRRTVRELLETLRGRGVAVLLNSHLLSEVELVCDRVAIIARGEVVAAGTPAELSHAGGVEVETGRGVRQFAQATREDVPRLVRELVEAGEEIYGVRVVRSSLEDVYLEVVGGR